MWAEACARLDEAERRHRRFYELLCRALGGCPCGSLRPTFLHAAPKCDVMVALPGARLEDVVAQMTPSGLLIETTVPPPAFEAGVEVVRLEIPYGRMRRRIELPAGTYTLIEHRLDRGYLFLRLMGSNL